MKKTVVSVATLTALAGTSVANIQAEEVTVKSGDTLWGIANAVGTTVADLKSANNLSSNLIHPGDVLSYSQSITKNDTNTYKVKAGDTLWAIGNQYGVSYSEIMKANNLKSDIIFPGQTLTINADVVEEVSAPEVAVESVETPVVETVEETNTTGAYVIQSGDTLYKISRETGVDLNTLKSINSLKSDLIFPGQVLVLTGEVEAPVVEEVEEKTEEVTETKVVEEVTETPEVEEVIEVVTEEAEVVEETSVVEEVSEPTEDLTAEQAVAEKAEADRVAAEQAAAQKAEADRVAAEQAAAQKAEADRIAREKAAQKAEADRVAAEQAAAQKAEADRIAREQAAQKAEADRVAAEQAAQKAEQQRIAAQQEQQRKAKAEADRIAAEKASTPVANTSSKPVSSYGHNYYFYGDCTWYAFERRKELGKGVSNMWGNGNNWADNARANGYNVNNTPSVGAIVHSYAGTNGSGGMGHVAIVESINPDGSITVSEMNWPTAGTKTIRTISADKVANHNFIH